MAPINRRNDDFNKTHPFWAAINALAVKVMPPLIVGCVMVVTAGAWATYTSVNKLTDKVALHEKELESLKLKIEYIEANSIKRTELLEILKRVEQQLEIALLRSGVKVPSKILSNSNP